MKQKIYRIIFFALALGVLSLLFFYLKNVIYEIILAAKADDEEAIAHILTQAGPLGMARVVLIEGLQMIVVFISAEFIQISAGICYPVWLATLLCDLGVVFGATAIYCLVNLLKFDRHFFKSSERIDRLAKRQKKPSGTQVLMYILFVMPIIPFGAICYFGASQKIGYRRYLFTCATGVLPSILSSLLMGKLLLFFTSNGLPIWLLILAIVLIAAVLFLAALIIIRKIYFKDSEGGMSAMLYSILMRVLDVFVGLRMKLRYDRRKLADLDPPYILLCNHASFFDFYYLSKLIAPDFGSIVCNRYYFRIPILRFIFKRMKVIPKSLFSADAQTAVSIIRSVHEGRSVLLFPEGRLSLDGTGYPLVEGTGSFLQRLGVPIAVARIDGAYLSGPKWRAKRMKSEISVGIADLIGKEEAASLTPAQIEERIRTALAFNDFAYAREKRLRFPAHGKATGLENILYRCPVCGAEYTIRTEDNTVSCTQCGAVWRIGRDYSFEENPQNISDVHDFYLRMMEQERKTLADPDFSISAEVHAIRKHPKDRKQDRICDGVCTLTAKAFDFQGQFDDGDASFSLPTENLPALAFSAGEEFECYSGHFLYYFYPKENPKQCVRWAALVDLMKSAEAEKINKT